MCGIAGIIDCHGNAPSRDEVSRMASVLRHRGPDATAAMECPGVALAHTRLSIIDLAGGRQPMQSEDGRFTLTFNGEIFNYREIRTRLRALGYRFRTQSDTEVLLTAYRHWGEGCVEHLNGQWAFGVWDRASKTLFLSRDRLGIRPLYYTRVGNRFLFASEVKALFADARVPRRIDPVGLDQVFTFWTSLAPRTVFEGIWELPPGCNLTLRDGVEEVRPYWRPKYSVSPSPADADSLAEELLDLLLDATRLRLRADVPVGVYVSGGLDSSINAALVRELADGPDSGVLDRIRRGGIRRGHLSEGTGRVATAGSVVCEMHQLRYRQSLRRDDTAHRAARPADRAGPDAASVAISPREWLSR